MYKITHIKEILMHYNIALQVDQIETYQHFKKKLLNLETLFHEILLQQGPADLGEQLEIQNSLLSLTTLNHPPPNRTSTHHYSCITKLSFCITKIMTIKESYYFKETLVNDIKMVTKLPKHNSPKQQQMISSGLTLNSQP